MGFIIPTLSVRPRYSVVYNQYIDFGNSTKIKSSWDLPGDNKTYGLISKKANKRVSNAIDWLLFMAKPKEVKHFKSGKSYDFKLSFVTLTLASKQVHSDKDIKSGLLNQFLTELRAKHGCKNYLWRAEAQGNGNIHFHVVTDVFIPWQSLRRDWNRIQEKFGYVSRYTAKSGKTDPNGTDVKAVHKVKNLSAYLSKYCGKNTKGVIVMATSKLKPPTHLLGHKWITPKKDVRFFRQIHGNLWGLSANLSKLKAEQLPVCDSVQHELTWMERKFPDLVRSTDYCRIFYVSVAEMLKMGLKKIPEALAKYQKKVFEKPPLISIDSIVKEFTNIIAMALSVKPNVGVQLSF